MHFNPTDTSLTCTPVRAWVETAKSIRDADGFHLGGVIVHIQNPRSMSGADNEVIRHIDWFLRAHRHYPVSTVANTISPQSLDHGDGTEALAERYMKVSRHSIKKSGWGRYFERFAAWPNPKRLNASARSTGDRECLKPSFHRKCRAYQRPTERLPQKIVLNRRKEAQNTWDVLDIDTPLTPYT